MFGKCYLEPLNLFCFNCENTTKNQVERAVYFKRGPKS